VAEGAGGDPAERNIPRKLGSIRVVDELGRGGMGVVFTGWDEVLHRPVAVKFLLGAIPKEVALREVRYWRSS